MQGDFADDATYERLAKEIGGAKSPVFYLEIPPSLFGMVVKGLSTAGLTEGARVVVEKPFGHDLESARELAAELHQYIDEAQLYRIDHFLGKMGTRRDPLPALRQRDVRAGLEPQPSRLRADHDGRGLRRSDRGHFYDPVGALRDVVVNHLMQVIAATAMEPPAGREARPLKDAMFAVFAAMPPGDPAHYVRGQYDGYRDVDGVAKDSTTETYAAARFEIDNWRWQGVPFFIRTGKLLPVTQTEVRLIFEHPPRLGFARPARSPEPDQLVIKLDPSTGMRLLVDAQRSDSAEPEQINLDMEFAQEGGEGPTPYEVLLHAAMLGDSTRFTRQDNVEQTWRIMQPLLDEAPEGASVQARVVGAEGRGQARRRLRRLARPLDRV